MGRRTRWQQDNSMWLMPLLFMLLQRARGECYFPFEYHGTYAVQSAQNQYSDVLVEINRILPYGLCHRKIGDNLILRDGSNGCLRCFHMAIRSPNVLQLHTRDPQSSCGTNINATLRLCPTQLEMSSPQRMQRSRVHELMMYKTKTRTSEAHVHQVYCPISGQFSFSFEVEDEVGGSTRCTGAQSQLSNCPYGFGLQLRFRGCPSRQRANVTFQCLADWTDSQGRNFMALLDVGAAGPSSPRYRCAMYKEELGTGRIRVAFSSDSSCYRRLETPTVGHERLVLYSAPSRPWPSVVSRASCTFPQWALGHWQDAHVHGNTIVYKDVANFRTYTARCIKDQGDKFVIYTRSHCGQETYNCIWLKERAPNVMEFQLGQVPSLRISNSLCHPHRFLDTAWITQGRQRIEHEASCPVTGRYAGTIPETGGQLCAKLSSDCTRPEHMFYTVTGCANVSHIYEGMTPSSSRPAIIPIDAGPGPSPTSPPGRFVLPGDIHQHIDRSPPGGRVQEGMPRPGDRSQDDRSPPDSRPQNGRPPPGGHPQNGRSSLDGRSQDGRSPLDGRFQDGRSPLDGRSQDGRSPPVGFSQKGRSPPDGSSQGSRSSYRPRYRSGSPPPDSGQQDGPSPARHSHLANSRLYETYDIRRTPSKSVPRDQSRRRASSLHRLRDWGTTQSQSMEIGASQDKLRSPYDRHGLPMGHREPPTDHRRPFMERHEPPTNDRRRWKREDTRYHVTHPRTTRINYAWGLNTATASTTDAYVGDDPTGDAYDPWAYPTRFGVETNVASTEADRDLGSDRGPERDRGTTLNRGVEQHAKPDPDLEPGRGSGWSREGERDTEGERNEGFAPGGEAGRSRGQPWDIEPEEELYIERGEEPSSRQETKLDRFLDNDEGNGLGADQDRPGGSDRNTDQHLEGGPGRETNQISTGGSGRVTDRDRRPGSGRRPGVDHGVGSDGRVNPDRRQDIGRRPGEVRPALISSGDHQQDGGWPSAPRNRPDLRSLHGQHTWTPGGLRGNRRPWSRRRLGPAGGRHTDDSFAGQTHTSRSGGFVGADGRAGAWSGYSRRGGSGVPLGSFSGGLPIQPPSAPTRRPMFVGGVASPRDHGHVTTTPTLTTEPPTEPPPLAYYEEREYRCLGTWTEGDVMYTYTQRRDVLSYECFVGRVRADGRVVIGEAGTDGRCRRPSQPGHTGHTAMLVTQRAACHTSGDSAWSPSPPVTRPPRPSPTTSTTSTPASRRRPPGPNRRRPTRPGRTKVVATTRWKPITARPGRLSSASCRQVSAWVLACLMALLLLRPLC